MTDETEEAGATTAATKTTGAENAAAVDPALIEKAVDLVRRAVRGNGVHSKDVKFDSFEGEILHFETRERFVIEPKTAEKLLHGKENGEVVGSQQEARQRVQATINKAVRNPDVRKYTVDILNKRPDLGFGLDDFFVLLDRLRRIFVVHEVCTVCSGNMTILCQVCHGNGKVSCSRCNTSREMVCPHCSGRQFENTPQGRQPCVTCKGHGRMPCDMCRGVGTLQCHSCDKGGKVSCKNCTGTGWHSHMTYLEMRARSLFTYEREALPPEVPPLLDTLRGEMVTEKHAEIHINDSKERADELDLASKPDEFFVPYNVRLPWGDLKLLLKDVPLEAKLFGFQPSLVHTPPFLEVTTSAGRAALAAAASGTGNVTVKIAQAARMRAVAQSILAAAQMSPRRGLDYMHKKYPFGFRAEVLQQMLKQSDAALKHVTKKPRLVGLGIGLLISTCLYGVYYLGPLRAIVGTIAQDETMKTAADLLLVILGGAITIFSIQRAAADALRKAIGKMLPPEKRKKLVPKAGLSAVWGGLGVLGVYLATVTLAAAQGYNVPEWYQALSRMLGLSS